MTLSAFGPFAGEESVDFDRLGADGLFLFCGATGAGKTSILDAVAFALYGRLPGARRETRNRVRSDHARPETTTYVELVCTLAGQTVRIRRSPEYERPKARGSGTTLQKHKVSLERRESDGSWVGVTDKADAVGDFVLDHLGLNADQFFQVVLLPQGEFAQFLRAEDSEREAVLKTLFGAERFAKVEEWFAALAKEKKADLAVYQSRLTELAHRAAQEAGVDEQPSRPDDAWFDRLVEAAVEAASIEATAAAVADDAHVAADLDLDAARETSVRVERRRRVRAERVGLDARRTLVDAERRRVEGALRVRSVRVLAETWERCRAAQASVAATVRELRARVEDVEPELAKGQATELRSWLQSRRRALGALTQALEDETRVAELRADELAALAAEARAADRLADLTRQRDALPAALDAGRRDRQRLAVRAADHAAATEVRTTARLALAAARRGADLHVAESAAERRLTDAVALSLATKETWLDVRERRLEGMAAELALGLTDGAACPVCGAQEHPSPAVQPHAAADAATERAARTAHEAAEDVRAATQKALAQLGGQLATAVAVSGGGTVDELLTALTVADTRILLAAQSRKELEQVERSIAAIEQQVTVVGASVAAAGRLHDSARSALDGLRAEIGQRESRVATSRGDYDTVATRVGALTGSIDVVQHLDDVGREEAEASRAVAAAHSALDLEVAELGLGSTSAAVALALTDAELSAAQAVIRDFDVADSASAGTLAGPDLQGLPDESPVLDVVRVQDALSSSRLAHARLSEAQRRAKALARLATSAHTVTQEAGPALTELEEVEQLTGLIRGDTGNRHRMRLTSYVLAARLEQVAEVASQRLEAMSDGRYRLEHTAQRTNQRRTGGLGLVVRDAYTGRSRPTRTLSGGESFLASLSLALGLAEVVAAEAGATTLDSLFVDEGFGSLDAETLDVVMDTLDDLRAGGRAIGLISHVEEMKARIQSKLHLIRDTTGSRVLPPEGQLAPAAESA